MDTSIRNEIIDQFVKPVAEKADNVIPTFFSNLADKKEQQSYPTRDEFLEALRIASGVPKSVKLQLFNRFHAKCASALTTIFYKIDLENLAEAAEFAKRQLNLDLVIYAYSVALRHRKDVGTNFGIPSHISTDPKMYVNIGEANDQVEKAKLKLRSKGCDINDICIDVGYNFTATDKEPEHKVAYFREDMGMNLHHRHWHEVYPFEGDEEIVNKDRRGEMFYYMHQQMIARFNWERLSNHLNEVESFSDIRAIVDVAYFPKLDEAIKTKTWSSRPASTKLRDVNRDLEVTYYSLSDMELWRDRIFDAIDRGFAFVKKKGEAGTWKPLVEPEAINDLGNTLEAVPLLTWNYDYYGNFHNAGHMTIAHSTDPDARFHEEAGVMGYPESSARDPIFYQFHKFIDDICNRYKKTLGPYKYEERYFSSIEVKEVKIVSEDVPKENTFKTFWEKDVIDITQGITDHDPNKEGRVFAKFTHLQHKNFVYQINVNNTDSKSLIGTVRIFIAPKFDESGQRMYFNKHRRFFVELDKFTTVLKSGLNTIVRKSTDSSVTIPFEQLSQTTEDVKKNIRNKDETSSYCGCGWPQYMLIAKGKAEGFPCQLFVMVSNYEDDRVEGEYTLSQKKESCHKSAVSFCGLRNKKFPDKRAMGFPFDRDVKDPKAKLEDFMTKSQNHQVLDLKEEPLSNMKVIDVEVKHIHEKPSDGPTILKNKDRWTIQN